MRRYVIAFLLVIGGAGWALAECTCHLGRECNDCYFRKHPPCKTCNKCAPCKKPCAPWEEQPIREEQGAFAAPQQQGPVQGESEALGFNGPSIHFPARTWRFPTITFGSKFRQRTNPRMLLEETTAPFVQETAQLRGPVEPLIEEPIREEPIKERPPCERPCDPAPYKPNCETRCASNDAVLLQRLQESQARERELHAAVEQLRQSVVQLQTQQQQAAAAAHAQSQVTIRPTVAYLPEHPASNQPGYFPQPTARPTMSVPAPHYAATSHTAPHYAAQQNAAPQYVTLQSAAPQHMNLPQQPAPQPLPQVAPSARLTGLSVGR